MQHWLHQIRCSGGGTTTTFAFIIFSCVYPFPRDVESDLLEIRCNPPDDGIRAARRSTVTCEARRIEPGLHCDPDQKELALCIYGNGRPDTSVCLQIWMIERYA